MPENCRQLHSLAVTEYAERLHDLRERVHAARGFL
jgi:hypothetical protein